jgi:hypothetical protein
VITFTLDFPGSVPDHYSILVDSSGKVDYTSGAAKTAASDSDSSDDNQPYRYSFALSPGSRTRIFDLAARARYFSANINYDKHRVANTGTKTLSYRDAQQNNQAKYNYTANPDVQQLTSFFQELSMTLEFGRRLQFDHQYQKLALDAELKSMEEAEKQGGIVEVQAIAPILQEIVNDSSVVNVSRSRAQRLLGKEGPAR